MDAVARYIRLALEPDVTELTLLLQSHIDEVGPLGCYDTLIRPALIEVGRRWEHDELTVGDEHLITALTEQLLADLSRRHAGSTHVAVAACTPGNRHRVGILMIADALGLAGWQAIVLGAETPAAEVGRMARDRGAELIALSLGLDAELDELASTLTEVRELAGDDVAIMIGGGPLSRRPSWEPPEGVVACSSAAEAHLEGSRLLGRVGSAS
jgi:MerR family transcriptional regulator, light-induced transcriptional regulator